MPDDVDEVRRAVREQLMQGASQIKLAAGGGVFSNFDPIDVARYSDEEFRAAVKAADSWSTYAAHCFNRADEQINRPALIPDGGKLVVTSEAILHQQSRRTNQRGSAIGPHSLFTWFVAKSQNQPLELASS
jgi:hypothetical protein